MGLRVRRRLLEVARAAIAEKLARGTIPELAPGEEELDMPAGAFVSLHVDGELRGCIGSLYADRPLGQTVAEMATAAATEDPRFDALRAAELRHTDIEVSVLTPFEPIRPEDVVVGRHGLYIVRGPRRGVLLPQVPVQYGWDRETFLAQVCRKAGLPTDAWRDPETLLLGFEAQVFSDLSEAEAR